MTKKPASPIFPNIITIIAAVVLIVVLLVQVSDRNKEQLSAIDELNARIAAQADELTAAQAELTAAQADLTAAQADLTAAQADLTAAQADLTALQSQLDAANAVIAEKEESLAAMGLELTETTDRLNYIQGVVQSILGGTDTGAAQE